MIDPEMITNNMTPHEFLLKYIDLMYSRISNIERLEDRMNNIVNSKEFAQIEQLMFDDICYETEYFKSIEECHNFANGATKEGLTVLISTFLTEMRLIMEKFEFEKNDTPLITLLEMPYFYESCNFFVIKTKKI